MTAKCDSITTLAKKPTPTFPAPKPPPPSPRRVVTAPPCKPRTDVVEVERDDRLRGRCRILLNEAQREIDRLRRSLGSPLVRDVVVREVEVPCDSPASPPAQRRTYAVDPIGKAPEPQVKLPQPAPPSVAVARQHITTIGTLLDVLV